MPIDSSAGNISVLEFRVNSVEKKIDEGFVKIDSKLERLIESQISIGNNSVRFDERVGTIMKKLEAIELEHSRKMAELEARLQKQYERQQREFEKFYKGQVEAWEKLDEWKVSIEGKVGGVKTFQEKAAYTIGGIAFAFVFLKEVWDLIKGFILK